LILVEFRTRVTSTRFTIGGFPREQEVQTTRRHRYDGFAHARKEIFKDSSAGEQTFDDRELGGKMVPGFAE
jgi:hypothetical protein